MNNWIILGIQVGLATVVYSLIFLWYVNPRVATLSFENAILPMLLLHVFRFTGLTLLVSGQADPSIPQDGLTSAAYGDLLSAIAALVAAIALRGRSGWAIPLIWIFSLISIVDILNVGRIAVSINLFSYSIGAMWLVLSWYLPTLLVTQIYMVYRLVNLRKESPFGVLNPN